MLRMRKWAEGAALPAEMRTNTLSMPIHNYLCPPMHGHGKRQKGGKRAGKKRESSCLARC
jgi:hypothetical protein